ncbi:MAG TPA: cytochrome c peroxidase [Polyangiaceae bacterium]|nr:cytochrome c peroxidase [Polyangiaceae bacterium]
MLSTFSQRLRMGQALRGLAVGSVVVAGALVAFLVLNRLWPTPWNAEERRTMDSLWLGRLPAVPADPSNRFADDPRAALLGARIFRDARFSSNGKVACASCHRPELAFTDGLKLARGVGETRRNAPSVAPAAFSPWFFWDGRRDSQWAQALSPLESSAEHATTRTFCAHLVARHYREPYVAIFGDLPAVLGSADPENAGPLGTPAAQEAWTHMSEGDRDAINRVFVNIGKSLAAYERRLRIAPSRFDAYAEQISKGNGFTASGILSADEIEGLRLFMGKARCILCHRGPYFSSFEFFSLGLPLAKGQVPDEGRAGAFRQLAKDPFTCLGRYSDAHGPSDCAELRFMAKDELSFLANFKTPSLRNVAMTAPYMHDGQFADLDQVIAHYDRAPEVPYPEHTDLKPIGLSAVERADLRAFLSTLTSKIVDPFAPSP